jgi:hypothetical protein
VKKIFSVLALAALAAPTFAQTLVAKTKPFFSGWAPSDFSSMEVRLNGRKGTDALTANKIIQRIPVKPLDVSLVTGRVTVLVPLNEIWEVRSVSVNVVPVNTTGVKPFDIGTLDFSTHNFPTPGQVLAIDVNYKTGEIFMGPAAVQPPAPAPAPSAAISVSPASLSLTVAQNAACAMPFTVTNNTSAQVGVSYSDSMAWMMDLLPKAHLTPQPIPAGGSLAFTLICSSATRGTFTGNGTITGGGATLTLPTSLTIQ